MGIKCTEYYTDKPTQVAGVDMLNVLFSRGRILLPYKHLVKSFGYDGQPPEQRYEYEWSGNRISTVRYLINSGKVVIRRITYK